MNELNMFAIRYHNFGGPEVLKYEETSIPQAVEGEVLVRVNAAGVNPADWKTIENRFRQTKPEELPLIPGWDVSGEVVEVGPGTTAFKVGDLVYGMLRFPKPGSAYAQYATAPTGDIALKPQNLDHYEAAAVPLAGLTAWQILHEKANIQSHQTVFINGAAGGVGHLAVQIARAAGCKVIGTASASKIEFLQSLGVDEPIDYQGRPFEEVVRDVDIFFDTIGNASDQAVQVLKPGGTLVSVVPFFPPNPQAVARQIKMVGHLVYPSGTQLADLTKLIEDGKLRPFLETVLPLNQAQQAHQLSRTERVKGKIVLQVI